MKPRTEYLVAKRDGRTEWLRATKLARSVHLALKSAGVDEDWRALEIASAVLLGLRRKRDAEDVIGAESEPLRSSEISDAVIEVLVATGQPRAAAAYGAVAAERARRRDALSWIGGRAAAGCEGLAAQVSADRSGFSGRKRGRD